MKKLLISAALVALLASPAMAQDRRDRGGQSAPAQAAPAQAAPAQTGQPAPGTGPGFTGHNNNVPLHASPAAGPGASGNNNSGSNNPPANTAPGGNNNNSRFQNNNSRFQNNNNNNNNRFNGPNRNPGSRQDFSNWHRNFNAPRQFRAPSYRRPSGWYAHRWGFGEFLPSLFWTPNYWLDDFLDYDLPPPPPGTVWVRDGQDALLIDRRSGEIIQVEYGIFY